MCASRHVIHVTSSGWSGQPIAVACCLVLLYEHDRSLLASAWCNPGPMRLGPSEGALRNSRVRRRHSRRVQCLPSLYDLKARRAR